MRRYDICGNDRESGKKEQHTDFFVTIPKCVCRDRGPYFDIPTQNRGLSHVSCSRFFISSSSSLSTRLFVTTRVTKSPIVPFYMWNDVSPWSERWTISPKFSDVVRISISSRLPRFNERSNGVELAHFTFRIPLVRHVRILVNAFMIFPIAWTETDPLVIGESMTWRDFVPREPEIVTAADPSLMKPNGTRRQRWTHDEFSMLSSVLGRGGINSPCC